MAIAVTPLVLCIVFPILSILSVIARFYARGIKRLKPAADDWMILPALLFAVGNAALVLYGAIAVNLGQRGGIFDDEDGHLIPDLHKLQIFQEIEYASETIVIGAPFFARISILLFYARIFSSRHFRIAVYIMQAINVAWGIAFTIVYLAQCIPLTFGPTKPANQHCVDISSNYAFAVSSIFLDVFVLCMPWVMVWRLQMSLRNKIAVLGIFMLGGIVVAVSIGKCYAFFFVGHEPMRDIDPTYDLAPLFYWTVPECCLFVVCACLPTLRPIFQNASLESVIRSVRSALSLSSMSNGSVSTSSKNYQRRGYSKKQSIEDSTGEFMSLENRNEQAGVQGFSDLNREFVGKDTELVTTVEGGLEPREMDLETGIRVQKNFHVREQVPRR